MRGGVLLGRHLPQVCSLIINAAAVGNGQQPFNAVTRREQLITAQRDSLQARRGRIARTIKIADNNSI